MFVLPCPIMKHCKVSIPTVIIQMHQGNSFEANNTVEDNMEDTDVVLSDYACGRTSQENGARDSD